MLKCRWPLDSGRVRTRSICVRISAAGQALLPTSVVVVVVVIAVPKDPVDGSMLVNKPGQMWRPRGLCVSQ